MKTVFLVENSIFLYEITSVYEKLWKIEKSRKIRNSEKLGNLKISKIQKNQEKPENSKLTHERWRRQTSRVDVCGDGGRQAHLRRRTSSVDVCGGDRHRWWLWRTVAAELRSDEFTKFRAFSIVFGIFRVQRSFLLLLCNPGDDCNLFYQIKFIFRIK